jgi:prepilin-type processing-associated H-X9-DG protein
MAENAAGGSAYKLAHTHAYIMGSMAPDAFRHNGLANIVFADGHAASFKRDAIYNSTITDASRNFGGIQWNPDRDLE